MKGNNNSEATKALYEALKERIEEAKLLNSKSIDEDGVKIIRAARLTTGAGDTYVDELDEVLEKLNKNMFGGIINSDNLDELITNNSLIANQEDPIMTAYNTYMEKQQVDRILPGNLTRNTLDPVIHGDVKPKAGSGKPIVPPLKLNKIQSPSLSNQNTDKDKGNLTDDDTKDIDPEILKSFRELYEVLDNSDKNDKKLTPEEKKKVQDSMENIDDQETEKDLNSDKNAIKNMGKLHDYEFSINTELVELGTKRPEQDDEINKETPEERDVKEKAAATKIKNYLKNYLVDKKAKETRTLGQIQDDINNLNKVHEGKDALYLKEEAKLKEKGLEKIDELMDALYEKTQAINDLKKKTEELDKISIKRITTKDFKIEESSGIKTNIIHKKPPNLLEKIRNKRVGSSHVANLENERKDPTQVPGRGS